jgi:hydrogenase expression/formation protein HypC
MCIGIPMQVIAAGPGRARCAGRGEEAWLDFMLLGDQPVGTWVLAFRGAAMRVLSAEEARATNAALDALAAILAGDGNVDAHFADLIDREPQLPRHLKGILQ